MMEVRGIEQRYKDVNVEQSDHALSNRSIFVP